MANDVLRIQSDSPDSGMVLNLTFDPEVPRPPSVASIESVDNVVYSSALQDEVKEAWPMKCVYPVLEILNTEETYVLALRQMLEGYRDPLTSRLQSNQDGEDFIRKVFSNLGQLFNIHRRLLQSLKSSVSDPREFGQAFVKAKKEFSAYTVYCTNFNTAVDLLKQTIDTNKTLKEFLEVCQQKLHHTLPLDAYLIKPVQRILKYHLLLQQVLKHFNLEHYAYRSLKEAHRVMTETAEHINNVQRQMENSVRAKEIQQSLSGGPTRKLTSYGELLYECKCKVRVGKKGADRERELILFDKLLLLLKKKDAKRYNYKGHIEVSDLGVNDISEPNGFEVFPRPRQSNQAYHVTVSSQRVKKEWVEKIEETVRLNAVEMEKKRQEMNVLMRKKRYGTDPRQMLASERNRPFISMERGRRKRKALTEIFPTSQNEDSDQLQKVSRIKVDTHEELMVDEEREGGREEGGRGEEEQRVPEDSGVILHPISEEESSMYTEPRSTDLLAPTQYVGHGVKCSVSMESMVSLSDIELGEGDDIGSHAHIGGRYIEDYDHGEEDEGDDEEQNMIQRNSSRLQRKPAIRVKRLSPMVSRSGSKTSHKDTMIREKAQLVRAEFPDQEMESQLGLIKEDGPELIGTANQTQSCDSSANSSTSLSNDHSALEKGDASGSSEPLVPRIVTDQEKGNSDHQVMNGDSDDRPYTVSGDGPREEAPLGLVASDSLQDTADTCDEIEIVDSSDSEDEEEEEMSMEEEFGSSVEQPLSPEVLQEPSDFLREDQTAEVIEEPDTQPARSDSSTPNLGMEDSGIGTESSSSGNFTKTADSEQLPIDIEGRATPPPHQSKEAADVYATMLRNKPLKYGKTLPPQTLIIPRDYSPGPHSHKSSSPSSTSSSISRAATKKSKGFSRLIEYTRMLSTSPYAEVENMSQALPPGEISEDILEEPSEFSNDVFGEPPGSEAECRESHVIHHDVITPPPPKKQALDSVPHDSDKVAMETHPSSDTNEVTIETAEFAIETTSPNTDEVVTETTIPQYDDKDVSIETQVTSEGASDMKSTQETDEKATPLPLESSQIPERELANEDREMQDEIVDVHDVSGDGEDGDNKRVGEVGIESKVAEDGKENLEDTRDIEEDGLESTRENLKEKDDEDIPVVIEENIIDQRAKKMFIEVEEDVLERSVETEGEHIELDNEEGHRNTAVSSDSSVSTGMEGIVLVVASELDDEAVVEEMVEDFEAKEVDVTIQTTASQSLSAHGDVGTTGVESEVSRERSEEGSVDEKMAEDLEAKEVDMTVQTTVQSSQSLPTLGDVGTTEVESEKEICKEQSEEGLVNAENNQNNRAVVQEEKYDNEHQIAAEYQLRQRHTQSSERDSTLRRTPIPLPPTVVSRGLFGAMQRRWLGWRIRQKQILLLGVGGFLTVAFLLGYLFEVV